MQESSNLQRIKFFYKWKAVATKSVAPLRRQAFLFFPSFLFVWKEERRRGKWYLSINAVLIRSELFFLLFIPRQWEYEKRWNLLNSNNNNYTQCKRTRKKSLRRKKQIALRFWSVTLASVFIWRRIYKWGDCNFRNVNEGSRGYPVGSILTLTGKDRAKILRPTDSQYRRKSKREMEIISVDIAGDLFFTFLASGFTGLISCIYWASVNDLDFYRNTEDFLQFLAITIFLFIYYFNIFFSISLSYFAVIFSIKLCAHFFVYTNEMLPNNLSFKRHVFLQFPVSL